MATQDTYGSRNTPFGPVTTRTNPAGETFDNYGSDLVDWGAFYDNMGAGENNNLGRGLTTAAPAPNTHSQQWYEGYGQSGKRYSIDQLFKQTPVIPTRFADDNPIYSGNPWLQQMLGYGGSQAMVYTPAQLAAAELAKGQPPGRGVTPVLPVQNASPELMQAYQAFAKGVSGADKIYADLLAAEAGRGNIGQTRASGNALGRPGPGHGQGASPGDRPTPMLPQFGRNGYSHNGSSILPAKYTSGGYLFDRTGAQISRDPNFKNRPAGSRGTAAGSDGARETTTAIQRANYDRQGIAY